MHNTSQDNAGKGVCILGHVQWEPNPRKNGKVIRSDGTPVGPRKGFLGVGPDSSPEKKSESWVGWYVLVLYQVLYQEPYSLTRTKKIYGGLPGAWWQLLREPSHPLHPWGCINSLNPNKISPLCLNSCMHVPFEILFCRHSKRAGFDCPQSELVLLKPGDH